jgi:hypothetical protein
MTDRVRHRVKVPASVANLDLGRVRRKLFEADGNITKAARALKVNSADLRRLTWRHPVLIGDALEQAHRRVDKAEEKLLAALDGDHVERSLRASFFILSHSAAARERGWSRHSDGLSPSTAPPSASPTVVIWAGGAVPPGYRPLPPEARVPDPPEDRRRH